MNIIMYGTMEIRQSNGLGQNDINIPVYNIHVHFPKEKIKCNHGKIKISRYII